MDLRIHSERGQVSGCKGSLHKYFGKLSKGAAKDDKLLHTCVQPSGIPTVRMFPQ